MKIGRVALLGGIATLALLGIAVFLLVRGGSDGEVQDVGDYADRELLLPDDSFTLPSVEEQVLQPQFTWYINPGEPLPEEIVDDVSIDLPEVVERTFRIRSEERIEEFLFDE